MTSPDLNELLQKFSDKTITQPELEQLKHKLEERIENTQEVSIAEIIMLGFVDARLAMSDKEIVREKEKSEG